MSQQNRTKPTFRIWPRSIWRWRPTGAALVPVCSLGWASLHQCGNPWMRDRGSCPPSLVPTCEHASLQTPRVSGCRRCYQRPLFKQETQPLPPPGGICPGSDQERQYCFCLAHRAQPVGFMGRGPCSLWCQRSGDGPAAVLAIHSAQFWGSQG